jgi:Fe-S cluster assembly ATPase SufC
MRQKINQVSNNLTIFDEWLDNAIDTVGFGIVMNVLKEKSEENDMAYYIISHRKEILPWISGETVMLEKKNRITRRV